jgi:HSP20 family protein
VSDTKDAVVVKAQVPGMTKENVQVSITEDALTLKGEMKEEEKKEDKNYHRREFRYGAFTRTIPLPMAVQADKATAQLKDGVLEITIPKSEQTKVKEIPVKVS